MDGDGRGREGELEAIAREGWTVRAANGGCGVCATLLLLPYEEKDP